MSVAVYALVTTVNHGVRDYFACFLHYWRQSKAIYAASSLLPYLQYIGINHLAPPPWFGNNGSTITMA